MPGLSEEDVDPDPISQFLSWYEYAPCDAVALVTASPQALPSGRMVLLKGVDKSGFVQLSAWASRQSEVIESRMVLEERIVELGGRFPDEVPCPPFWGGYRLIPTSVEFWHHRDDRLHDRLLYERTQEGWALKRLSP